MWLSRRFWQVEAELKALAEAEVTEAAALETELRLMRTERQAIEAAHAQRKLFLIERERQLAVERREVDRARLELCSEQHTVRARPSTA